MAGAERAGGMPCHRLGRRISIEKNSEREGWGHGCRWPQLNRFTQKPAKIRCRPWEGHGEGARLQRNVWVGAFCNCLMVANEAIKNIKNEKRRGLKWL